MFPHTQIFAGHLVFKLIKQITMTSHAMIKSFYKLTARNETTCRNDVTLYRVQV